MSGDSKRQDIGLIALAIFFFVIAIIATLGRCAKAQEAANCTDYAALTRHLESKFGETREIIAATGGGLIMEITISAKGTWTILIVYPSGKACIQAAGDGWHVSRGGRDG